jgi:hypothetical protein
MSDDVIDSEENKGHDYRYGDGVGLDYSIWLGAAFRVGIIAE